MYKNTHPRRCEAFLVAARMSFCAAIPGREDEWNALFKPRGILVKQREGNLFYPVFRRFTMYFLWYFDEKRGMILNWLKIDYCCVIF